MTSVGQTLAKDRPLRDSEARQTVFVLPTALSNRLDRLVEITEAGGVRASRRDVVAALILAAPETTEALLEMHLNFGTAKETDAGIKGEPAANVLQFDHKKPGRRRRSAS